MRGRIIADGRSIDDVKYRLALGEFAFNKKEMMLKQENRLDYKETFGKNLYKDCVQTWTIAKRNRKNWSFLEGGAGEGFAKNKRQHTRLHC